MFVVALAALGGALHVWLPPEPRWAVRGAFHEIRLLPDGSAVAGWASSELWQNSSKLRAPSVVVQSPLTLYETSIGTPLRTFFEGAGRLWSWAICPSGRWIAAMTADSKIWIADVQTGEEWYTILDLPEWVSADLTFSPDGEYLAIQAVRRATRLLHTPTGRLVHTWPTWDSHDRFSPDGAFFVHHAQIDKTDDVALHIWNLRTAAPAGVVMRARCLAFSANSKTLFVQQKDEGGSQEHHVVAWDLSTAKPSRRIGTVSGQYLDVRLSLDQRVAAVLSMDALEFCDLVAGKRIAQTKIPGPRGHGVFSPDGKRLAESTQTELIVYDSATAVEIWHGPWHDTLARSSPLFFSSDSQALVVCSSVSLELRSAATGTLKKSLFDTIHYAVPPTAAWSRDRLVAFETMKWGGSWRQGWLEEVLRHWLPAQWLPPSHGPEGIYVLDARTGQALFELTDRGVESAVLSEDGLTLVTVHDTGEEDGQLLRCWDVPAAKPLRWVLGMPLAAGVLLVSFRAGWRKWRQHPRPVREGAPPCH
jgi:WD40 repeat protein